MWQQLKERAAKRRYTGSSDKHWGITTRYRDDSDTIYFQFGTGGGDHEDNENGNSLKIQAFGRGIIIELPNFVKPHKEWIDLTKASWYDGTSGGYEKVDNKEYGFYLMKENHHFINDKKRVWHYLNFQFGRQSDCSSTTKSKGFFIPWNSWRFTEHIIYNLDWTINARFPDVPRKLRDPKIDYFRIKDDHIKANVPKAVFEFKDYDGEVIQATLYAESRHWKRGEGLFKWLSLLNKPASRYSFDIEFNKEVGSKKGSWKGGTLGHSVNSWLGEPVEAAWLGYCFQNNLTPIRRVA